MTSPGWSSHEHEDHRRDRRDRSTGRFPHPWALADTSGEWAVRAITRNPDGDGARRLAAAGAEVVRADLDDVESLTEAFDGAYGAFCVTNFWEHFSGAKEIEQARNLAQAAGSAGVRHVI